jgi:hypothetical protein
LPGLLLELSGSPACRFPEPWRQGSQPPRCLHGTFQEHGPGGGARICTQWRKVSWRVGGTQGSRSAGSQDKPERLSTSFFGEGEAAMLSGGAEAKGSLESLDGALLRRQTPGLGGGRGPWLSGGSMEILGGLSFFLGLLPGPPRGWPPRLEGPGTRWGWEPLFRQLTAMECLLWSSSHDAGRRRQLWASTL